MKILSKLDSLDNVQDGNTRKLITKTTSSGNGNAVTAVSVSGDTITYTKGTSFLTSHQSAFSNVKVGSSTIEADQAGDTLELVAGSNVTLTPDTTNDKVTIAATDTTYESKTAASGGTEVSLVTTGEKYTWNNKGSGTITKVQANGTDVASSGTANIPAASTSAYGVTKLSNATDSTSEVLAATPKAVKAAYDLAAGKGTGTITGVSVNGTSVATSGVANITSVPASILSGAIANGVTATTQSSGDNSTKVATTAYVDGAIAALPEPMLFKGSVGTGGTVTWANLATAAAANEGWTYKVITDHTEETGKPAAKVGDTIISTGSEWVVIPSGDEPSGTVTSVTIKATSPIAIDSENAITSSGTRTLSHANSGVTAGTYKSVTVNATGHVTGGTNPTTISGYGITDAKIASGVITLGSNTITPLTSSSTLDATKLSGTIPSGCYTDTKNTAGSTDSSSKLFLIGATSQATNPQTYSQDTAYVGTDGKLYSNSKEVVNLSDTQALTNKTYNGYTLAGASAKAVDTSISEGSNSANLPTSAAVANYAPIKTKTGTNGNASITNKIDVKSDIYGGIEINTKASFNGDYTEAYNLAVSEDETSSYAAIGSAIKRGNGTHTASVSAQSYIDSTTSETCTEVYIDAGNVSIGSNNLNISASNITMGDSGGGPAVTAYGDLTYIGGDIGISGNSVSISNVVNPTNNTDAANKQYVDNKIRYGTSDPSSSLGNNGDIYIKISSS